MSRCYHEGMEPPGSGKQQFQFTTAHLMWAVVISAVVLGMPWFLPIALFFVFTLPLLIIPLVKYLRAIEAIERERPTRTRYVLVQLSGLLALFLSLGWLILLGVYVQHGVLE